MTRGQPVKKYNPYQLINEVMFALDRAGLRPYLHGSEIGLAREGAEQMLLALGIAPVVESEEEAD